MPIRIGQVKQRNVLKQFTSEQVVEYVRKTLIEADGNAQAIATLYTQALAYTQSNAALMSTMATFQTLHNTAYPADQITLGTNAGKAKFLLYFINAVSLWSKSLSRDILTRQLYTALASTVNACFQMAVS